VKFDWFFPFIIPGSPLGGQGAAMLNFESEFIRLGWLATQAQRRWPGDENRDSGTASTNRIGCSVLCGHA